MCIESRGKPAPKPIHTELKTMFRTFEKLKSSILTKYDTGCRLARFIPRLRLVYGITAIK
jgi:hypothetical protein